MACRRSLADVAFGPSRLGILETAILKKYGHYSLCKLTANGQSGSKRFVIISYMLTVEGH